MPADALLPYIARSTATMKSSSLNIYSSLSSRMNFSNLCEKKKLIHENNGMEEIGLVTPHPTSPPPHVCIYFMRQ